MKKRNTARNWRQSPALKRASTQDPNAGAGKIDDPGRIEGRPTIRSSKDRNAEAGKIDALARIDVKKPLSFMRVQIDEPGRIDDPGKIEEKPKTLISKGQNVGAEKNADLAKIDETHNSYLLEMSS